MTDIKQYTLGPVRTHGTGREGSRWSASIYESGSAVGEVNEDGNGGELRYCFYSGADERDFREAASKWAVSVAPPRHKCVASADAWTHHTMGTPLDELVTLFFAEDIPPPTRPPTPEHLDNAVRRLLHTLRLGHAIKPPHERVACVVRSPFGCNHTTIDEVIREVADKVNIHLPEDVIVRGCDGIYYSVVAEITVRRTPYAQAAEAVKGWNQEAGRDFDLPAPQPQWQGP